MTKFFPDLEDRQSRVIHALEIGSNDPLATDTTRREMERCLRNQKIMARWKNERIADD